MTINVKRCDLVGYLSTHFFAETQSVAQITIDYLDDEHTNTIFFAKPPIVVVDEDYSIKPPPYDTIDRLRQSLQENGPLVTRAKIGPSAYTEAPRKWKKVWGKEVYGWKPGTAKKSAPQITAILVGTQKTESRSYIYFIHALDITNDCSSLIRGYKPSKVDTRIYVMSYDNFLERALVDLHPVCPHSQWLFSVPVNSLLEDGAVEKRCKQVGQEIFDHYKAKKGSKAGEDAVKRICDAAKLPTFGGRVRYAHINHAWEGIGDGRWRWQR